MRAPGAKVFGNRKGFGQGDEAQRALDAGARELPSPELTRRMAEGLGLASSTIAAAAAYAAAEMKASGLGARAASALVRPAFSVSVVAIAVAGAVVGGLWSRQHGTSIHASAPSVVPTPETVAPAPVPPPPPAPALAVDERAQASSASAVWPSRTAPSRLRAKAPPASGDFRAEIALVDAIRAAILARNDGRALSLLETYDQSYRTGMFRLETATLRIEVLARLGQSKRARALAAIFLASNPDSVLAARVERATGLAPATTGGY